MLDITTISRTNISSVVGYYADAKDDYYSKDSDFSTWQGSGAEMLNLQGPVDSGRFKELLVGEIDPFTQMKRDQRDASKERLAYDFTFSAPKGVSIQALVHGDKAIIEAHDKAVIAAIKEAENLVQTRETKQGVTRTTNTNNLVTATFRHETSRALDPELHSHAVVMNMTKREDGQWRAIKNDDFFKHKMFLGDVYKEKLALELVKQGFELRYDSKNGTFDLAHFSEEQIKAFSSRGNQIESELQARGLARETASAELKNQIALATRQKKVEVSKDDIYAQWTAKAKEAGIDFNDLSWKGKSNDSTGPEESYNQAPNFTSPQHQADKAIQFAIKSLSERDASFSEEKLLAIANKHALGRADRKEVEQALERYIDKGGLIASETRYQSSLEVKGSLKYPTPHTAKEWIERTAQTGLSHSEAKDAVLKGIASGRLKATDRKLTTVEGINTERSILKLETRGRGVMPQIIDRNTAEEKLQGKTLKPEQLESVLTIASSKNRFIAAHGYAGTGKSYMTLSAKEVIESQGYKVTALAPYGTQKKSLQDEGLDAKTVAAFLKSKDKKLDEKSVVFIDEAGVIPARQMKQLMDVIEKSGSRAIFLGDTSQTKAVEAGKPFEQLIEAGMQTSYLKDIQRQKNEILLSAVKYAAEGNTRESLSKLKNIYSGEHQERYESIANKYVSMGQKERDSTLIISGTNESRVTLNTLIRDKLGISGKGERFEMLERVDSTKVERLDSRYYKKGQVVIPEKDYKNGLERGKSYIVTDTGPGNKLTVESEGKVISFSPRNHTNLSVYEKTESELSPGDKVMITRNDKNLDVANGDRYTVKAIKDGALTLENEKGRTLELSGNQSRYLSYAYATTVHKSQGLTCDNVLFNIDTKSLTTSKDVFYVGISRARHDVTIYTDDSRKLSQSISRKSPKTKATDVDRFNGLEKRFIPAELQSDVKPAVTRDISKSTDGEHIALQGVNVMKDRASALDVTDLKSESNDLRKVESEQLETALKYADNHEETAKTANNPYHDYVQLDQHFNDFEMDTDRPDYYSEYAEQNSHTKENSHEDKHSKDYHNDSFGL